MMSINKFGNSWRPRIERRAFIPCRQNKNGGRKRRGNVWRGQSTRQELIIIGCCSEVGSAARFEVARLRMEHWRTLEIPLCEYFIFLFGFCTSVKTYCRRSVECWVHFIYRENFHPAFRNEENSRSEERRVCWEREKNAIELVYLDRKKHTPFILAPSRSTKYRIVNFTREPHQ